MFWVRRIRDFAAVIGLAVLAGGAYFLWLTRPLPEIEVDWEGIAGQAIEAGRCDLAYNILLDEASDGAAWALEAAETLLAEQSCPLTAPGFAGERLEWAREDYERTTNSEESFVLAHAPLSDWLSRLSTSFYTYDEAMDAGVKYPAYFWFSFAAKQLRCEMTPYDELDLWWRIGEASDQLKDPALSPRPWRRWEQECAARSLNLAKLLDGALLSEDDAARRAYIGDYVSGLLWEAADGTEDVQIAAEYERARLELELGAQLGANACQAAIPNAAPNATGGAAITFAQLYLDHGHVRSAERLAAMYETGRFLDRDDAAAAFWRFAAARAAGEGEALAVFDEGARESYEAVLEDARVGAYEGLYAYLPETPTLEDFHCREWDSGPVTRAADKPKGAGEAAGESPGEAAAP